MTVITEERSYQEALTAEFIAADPVHLSIWRATPVSDGAGGKLPGTPVVVYKRVFRLIPQSRQSAAVVTQTSTGTSESPIYVILATSDVKFKRDDYFTWRGFVYVISSIHEKPEYESKGDVYRSRKAA